MMSQKTCPGDYLSTLSFGGKEEEDEVCPAGCLVRYFIRPPIMPATAPVCPRKPGSARYPSISPPPPVAYKTVAVRRYLFFLIVTLSSSALAAQAGQDTLVLPVAELVSPRSLNDLGTHDPTWTSTALTSRPATDLAELLRWESGIFIKGYGQGSLATSSVRGGAAGHLSVLWNGLPLQSPMLGLLDLSLLPTEFMDVADIQLGGQSAAYGSGAVAGTIALGNFVSPTVSSSLSVRFTGGSFGLRAGFGDAAYRLGKWQLRTRLLHRRAENDFPYQLRADLPEKRQQHAQLRLTGLLQEAYLRPAPGRELAVRVWAQESFRQLPPTTVQNRSQATQADESIRASLHWTAAGEGTALRLRGGLFREAIDYRDEAIGLYSPSHFYTAFLEGEKEWTLGRRHLLLAGWGNQYLWATIPAYERPARQWRAAPFAAYRYADGKWRAAAQLRQEMVDGRLVPLIPSLELARHLSTRLEVSAKLSRNYRLPTFNDLYWRPGGNPALRPETGWGREIGLEYSQPGKLRAFNAGLTAYQRRLKDWIYWSPTARGFYEPRNLTRVRSRGLETRLQYRQTLGRGHWQVAGGGDYVESTNETDQPQIGLAAGQQLPYVPRYRAFGSLQGAWRQLTATYRHQYTGAVTGQNVARLDAYHLASAQLSYRRENPRCGWRLLLEVDNLWNTTYRAVERRVMPGRNFRLSVEFTLRQAPADFSPITNQP